MLIVQEECGNGKPTESLKQCFQVGIISIPSEQMGKLSLRVVK